jgi:hypothetical protein
MINQKNYMKFLFNVSSNYAARKYEKMFFYFCIQYSSEQNGRNVEKNSQKKN